MARRNSALAPLDALVGTWDMTVMTDAGPLTGAWCTFDWIEGGAFLRMRSDAELSSNVSREWRENSPFPVTVIIGLEDRTGGFGYLYADGRGVHRLYSMSFDGRDWRIWGQAGPEFFQRFHGAFTDDGSGIDARWEKSRDGEDWQLDFELSYTRR
jgi:hypothetical protein